MPLRWLLLLLVAALTTLSCLGGVPPLQRVSDRARELNLAARFGQMGVVMEMVEPQVREDYQLRRKLWGGQIRILDVEVTNVSLRDEEHAVVGVSFSWSSVTDSLLRATNVTQEWENRVELGWVLVRETRHGGDVGLFGEMLPEIDRARPDVHRPSRTLR